MRINISMRIIISMRIMISILLAMRSGTDRTCGGNLIVDWKLNIL